MSQAIAQMFWIAEYTDGQALPQFDLDTGKENLFKDIDFSKLKRFGWYPFTLLLAEFIPYAMANPLLPSCVIALGPEDKLIACCTKSIAVNSTDLKVIDHKAVLYNLGIEGKYLLSINVETNQIICK